MFEQKHGGSEKKNNFAQSLFSCGPSKHKWDVKVSVDLSNQHLAFLLIDCLHYHLYAAV